MKKVNKDIEISSLAMDDIDDVLKISNLSFHTPWSRDSIQKELEGNKFARYVVAKKGSQVIGYGGAWVIFDEAHVTNIAVHPEYRGIGAGAMIVEALIEICKVEMVSGLTLEVRQSNIVAQNLYKKFGFVEEGIRKGYYQDTKEDGIIMWKYFK